MRVVIHALTAALRCGSAPASLAIAVALIGPAQAVAVDSEPLNNSQLTADSLPELLPGTAISNLAGLGGDGGDVDFFQTPLAAGEVLFGMVTPLAGVSSPFESPLTVVSVIDDSGSKTFHDSGLSDLGGFGTYGAILRFAAPATADYRIGVSGLYDFEFDGDASGDSHLESGAYVLTAGRVNPAIPGGDFSDTDPANHTAAGADPISLSPGEARVAVAELTAGDVDFFRLDLKEGDILSVLTAPLADLPNSLTMPLKQLGLFDSSGTNLLLVNAFAGSVGIFCNENGCSEQTPDFPFSFSETDFGFGAALQVPIPTDGKYYLAVTGFLDDGFAGVHSEVGAYAMLVGLAAVPEPSSLALFALAIPALVRRCRQQHH
jgi:hypothetical protein